MRRGILAPLLLALAACRARPESSACDLDALAELGRELPSQSLTEQAERVWPGIVAACGAVPWSLNHYFDPEFDRDVLPRRRDPQLAALQNLACPGWDELTREYSESSVNLTAARAFERCRYARYQVFAADEIAGSSPAIMTWATHQWLLGQGLDPGAAAPITRALFARDQIDFFWIERYDDLRWPKAHGVPFGDGLRIYVSRSGVGFESRWLLALADGVLVDRTSLSGLREALDDAARRKQALLIVADAQTPMATFSAVLAVARRAGFERQGVFVEPEAYVPTYIPITPAQDEPTPDWAQTPMFMTIEIEPEGLTLGRGWGVRQSLEAHSLTNLEAVSSFAEDIRRRDPRARRVVVSAPGSIPLEQALAIIEAARGLECSETGVGCSLPEVVLRSEAAHDYPKTNDGWEALPPAAYGLLGDPRN